MRADLEYLAYNMKKYLYLSLTCALVLAPVLVFAQESGFVPLTNIDAVKFTGNSSDLPNFLNNIYKICIGLAAVLGVLQIMRAGLTWMTAAGSHEKLGEAKGLIRDAILGLILVLAPTIVFSIINPDILDLKIGGLDQLDTVQNVNSPMDPSTPNPNPPGSETADPTGDTLSNTMVGGDFFYKYSSYSEAQTQTYVVACPVVPDAVRGLVDSRKARQTTAGPAADAPPGYEYANLHTIYCESTSKLFWYYYIHKVGTPDRRETETQLFPKYGPLYTQLKNGCAENGGSLERTGWITQRCLDEMETQVEEMVRTGGGDPKDFNLICGRATYTCQAK